MKYNLSNVFMYSAKLITFLFLHFLSILLVYEMRFSVKKGFKTKLYIDGYKYGLSNKRGSKEIWRCVQYRELGFVCKIELPNKFRTDQ